MKNKGAYLLADRYLESFKREMSDFEPKQVKLIYVARRILKGVVAVDHGPRHDYYKYLKKDLTEHKVIEYFIESILKSEVASFGTYVIDYSCGIFEVLRLHGTAVKNAVMTMLCESVQLVDAQEKPKLVNFEHQDVFQNYILVIGELGAIADLVDPESTETLHALRNKLIDEVCSLCDELKDKVASKTLVQGHYLMNMLHSMVKERSELGSLWGDLRIDHLCIELHKFVVAYKQKAVSEQEPHDVHPVECNCIEHTL